ncbi:PucR family transcriptional regulator [Cohnella panacarvi]|uniref:PucR family transcriptional regulator n=1 Tax=Cohnella panacarvi TaxID=400776 RepID=UPI00047C750E|nr:PucR family transcriptional regulator ligand-binding domain-containing protein [Cohnella panacarvi]
MAMLPRKESSTAKSAAESIFTVNELMAVPLMRDAKLVAGQSGLDRAIARVSAMELPDIESWVKPGDFLMTTGRLFQDEPERFLQLVPELVKRGVAAMGIMAKPYLKDIPSEVKKEADRFGFALVELPPDLEFSDVVRVCMERVLALETSQLSDLQNRIQSMTRLLLEGGGLYPFLDALEGMLGNPVVVVREQDKSWLSTSIRNADAVEISSLLQSFSFKPFVRGAAYGFSMLQNGCRVYASPIPSRNMNQACLVLLERYRDISSIDALSIDRLSTLVGLEMANVEAVREVEGKYLDQFLQDWLTGKIVSDADWKLRADVCGCTIPEGSRMCAVLAGWRQKEPNAEKLREVTRRLRSERLRSIEGLFAAPIGNDLALVLPLGKGSLGDQQAAEGIDQLLGRLLAELRPVLDDKELKLYAGRVVDRYDGLHGSWSQAGRARQVAEVCGLPGEVITYDRLGVYSLLYLIPPGEEREQFLLRFAAPLQQADRKGGGRLVETLEMFFRCNGNIKLTSEKLYAHYNTIVYRLEKIQSILGVSLDDPEERLQLHLALKLGQIATDS